jgi:hypothetical protein
MTLKFTQLIASFMINFGESHTPIARPFLRYEFLKWNFKVENSRGMIVRIC